MATSSFYTDSRGRVRPVTVRTGRRKVTKGTKPVRLRFRSESGHTVLSIVTDHTYEKGKYFAGGRPTPRPGRYYWFKGDLLGARYGSGPMSELPAALVDLEKVGWRKESEEPYRPEVA